MRHCRWAAHLEAPQWCRDDHVGLEGRQGILLSTHVRLSVRDAVRHDRDVDACLPDLI